MWWRKQNGSSPYQKWVRPRFSGTPMLWALVMWLCALPLLALLAAPLLGWEITAYLAGFLLVTDVIVCSYMCRVRLPRNSPICAKCLRRLSAQVLHTQVPKGEYEKKMV